MAVTEIVAPLTVRDAKCFPPPAPIVAKIPKCRSSLVKAGRYIVTIAAALSDRAGNTGFFK